MTLRTRWILWICTPIAGVLVTLSVVTWATMMTNADLSARYWQENIFQNTTPAVEADILEDLQGAAYTLRHTGVAGATMPDPGAIAESIVAYPSLRFSLRSPEGVLVGGLACNAPALAAHAGGPAIVTCDGGPAAALEMDGGGAYQLTLLVPFDRKYLADIKRASLLDFAILGPDKVEQSTFTDENGQAYLPSFDAEPAVLRPLSGVSFGKARIEGGRYEGFGQLRLSRGDSRVPAYVSSTRLGEGWLLSAVPQTVMTTVPTYVAVVIILAACLLCGALVLLVSFLIRRVTEPLSDLSSAARRVQSGDLRAAVTYDGADELGEVCRTFNLMIASVREGRRELAEASRISGMVEVATGVLHNVGNVLTSVNVSTEVLERRIQGVRSDRLVEAASLLDRGGPELATFLSEDPRGRILPGYLLKATRLVHQERGEMLEEIRQLKQNVDRIKSIVSLQQSHAKNLSGRSPERLDLLLEDALQMVEASYKNHGIRVIRQFASLPAVSLDIHRITQVLVNLLVNARDALVTASPQAVSPQAVPPQAAAANDRRVTLTTRLVGQSIEIAVEDNGGGIRSDDMPRIFSFGHTTKLDGHGFGLHMSAVAAQSMGGNLTCTSDGPGRGACFTLNLPFEPATVPMESCA